MSEYRLTQQGPQVQDAIDRSLALTNATPVLAGKMSAPDKAKLDSIVPGNYQERLVSGANLKTVNGLSLLGSGNIQVGGIIDTALSSVSTNAVQNRVVKAALDEKQNIIADLAEIRANASGGYKKPSNGIPFTDLDASVQQALGAALTAVQVETDPTVPAWAKASTKPTYSLSELTDDATHRTVSDAEKEVWDGAGDAVKWVAQGLTESQKAQARSNIGAPSVADLSALSSMEYVKSWDGASTPLVSQIPEGVVVEYNGVTYTGTLEADENTAGNIYLVSNGDGYVMYISTTDGSDYVWESVGTTQLDLSGYATKQDLDNKFIFLTEEQFDALSAYDPTKIYCTYES